MNKPRKPFSFKQFTIHQNGAALPVTTDACIFGALVEFQQPTNILDLGTGTGLLLHMMAQKYPNATLTGIDIHRESLECAQFNIHQNQLPNKIHLLEGDFLNNQTVYPTPQYDSIISNPPFFENQLKSVDPTKSKSRHFENGEMNQFFKQLNHLLTPNGIAFLLLPINQEVSSTTSNLYIKKTIFIHTQIGKTPHLKVVELTKQFQEEIKENFYVRNSNKLYTEQFCRIMSPFYLEQAFTVNQTRH
jgi:tRNA1Val (adenine37-N6)-methyltransferase